MCGITLLINKNKDSKIDLDAFVRMNNSIEHRGPDSEGYAVVTNNLEYEISDSLSNNTKSDLKLIFGFRRLSILDLSSLGNQPMLYKNKYLIVFNGEIYNFIELRNELSIKGYTFNTNTDTEVIAASYDYWGVKCLNKFNGMWAITLLNLTNGEIFISRDRFGVKPLYYYEDSNVICCVSEIKQLKHYLKESFKANTNRIKQQFEQETEEFGNETDFDKVYRFPNASYTIFNISTPYFEIKKYYELPPLPQEEEYSESKAITLADNYYSLLKDAVKLRLRSDVKIGTCLSGGLDSSSIAYLINKSFEDQGIKEMQKTFSLVFTENDTKYCDESGFIDSIAERLNLDKHYIEPTLNEVIDYYPKVVYHMDNIQHSSLMSYCFTYKLVHDQMVKVTLDGQGADELQGGYTYYLTNFFTNIKTKDLKYNYKLFKDIPGAKKYIAQGLVFNLLKNLGLSSIIKFILTKLKFKTDPFLKVNEALRRDFNCNLQTLLHYGDRGSMMHSVESRFPFLDYRMVEFWHTLPSCYKIHNGYTKYIARKAFDQKLPDNIVWRRDKKGWELPQKTWLENGLLKNINNTIINGKFLYKIGKLNTFNKAKNDLSNKNIKTIIKCFNAELWHKTFFNS